VAQRVDHRVRVVGRDQPHLAGQSEIKERNLAVVSPSCFVVDIPAGNGVAVGVTAVDARERSVRVVLPQKLEGTRQCVVLP
jgi:hypothetical protein